MSTPQARTDFRVFAGRSSTFWLGGFSSVLVVFAGGPIAVNALQHTFTASDCGLGRALLLFSQDTPEKPPPSGDVCGQAVFTFDLPSLLLGAGIVLSLCVHIFYIQLLKRFAECVRDDPLYVYPRQYLWDDAFHAAIAGAGRRVWNARRVRRRARADAAGLSDIVAQIDDDLRRDKLNSDFVTFFKPPAYARLFIGLLVAAAGVVFNRLATHNGYLFASIRSAQKDTVALDVLRRSWWADWDHHRFGMLVWCVVGVVGAYVAVIDLAMSARLAGWLQGKRSRSGWRQEKTTAANAKAPQDTTLESTGGEPLHAPRPSPVRGVRVNPKLREDEMLFHVDNGVRPLVLLQDLKFIGMFNFAIVAVALVFLCRDPDSLYGWNVVLAVIVVFVIVFSIYSAALVRSVRLRLRRELLDKRLADVQQAYEQFRANPGRPRPTRDDARLDATVASARWLFAREDATLFSKGVNVAAVVATLYGTLFAIFPSVRPY